VGGACSVVCAAAVGGDVCPCAELVVVGSRDVACWLTASGSDDVNAAAAT
jgi:hypothetical protein